MQVASVLNVYQPTKRAFDFLFAVLLTAFLTPALSVGASDASSDASRGADIPNGAASVRTPAPPAEPTLFPAEPRAEAGDLLLRRREDGDFAFQVNRDDHVATCDVVPEIRDLKPPDRKPR